MSIDSKNIAGAGFALAVVGIAVWASTIAFNKPIKEHSGTVEIKEVAMSMDDMNAINAHTTAALTAPGK